MAKPAFHSSIEGAQHSPKGLDGFLAMAKSAGAGGAQPSNYMLEASEDGTKLKSAKEVKDAFEQAGLKLDGLGREPKADIRLSMVPIKTSRHRSWNSGMRTTVCE